MNANLLKERLKQNSLIYMINAKIKSVLLKNHLRLLRIYYSRKANIHSYVYDETQVINSFKEKHLKLKKDFIPKKQGDLKIFWVGALESQDKSGFLQALNRIGSVSVFYNHDGKYGPLYEVPGLTWLEVRQRNDDALLQQITKISANEGIDFLIGQMWSHIFSPNVLLEIQSLGIPIINIAMDDRLPNLWSSRNSYRMGSVGLGSGVNLTLTTVPETCKWYAVEGMLALFWPLASDNKLFAADANLFRDIDILFIGNRYGIRSKLIEYLKKKGISVTCFGNGWENGYVDAKTNISLSKRAKIILGVGTVGHCSDVYTLKLRDFDALMTGALYLTHRNPDLLHLFKEGEHLECYESKKELYTKLDFYINNLNKANEIGTRGAEVAKSKHSWDYRLSSTFRLLGFIS